MWPEVCGRRALLGPAASPPQGPVQASLCSASAAHSPALSPTPTDGLWGQSRDKGMWNRREGSAQAPTTDRGAGTAVRTCPPPQPQGPEFRPFAACRGKYDGAHSCSNTPGARQAPTPSPDFRVPRSPRQDQGRMVSLAPPAWELGWGWHPCVHTACRGLGSCHGSACPSPSCGLSRAPRCHDVHGCPRASSPRRGSGCGALRPSPGVTSLVTWSIRGRVSGDGVALEAAPRPLPATGTSLPSRRSFPNTRDP